MRLIAALCLAATTCVDSRTQPKSVQPKNIQPKRVDPVEGLTLRRCTRSDAPLNETPTRLSFNGEALSLPAHARESDHLVPCASCTNGSWVRTNHSWVQKNSWILERDIHLGLGPDNRRKVPCPAVMPPCGMPLIPCDLPGADRLTTGQLNMVEKPLFPGWTPPPADRPLRVVIMGASSTAGCGANPVTKLRCNVSLSWGRRFADELGARLPLAPQVSIWARNAASPSDFLACPESRVPSDTDVVLLEAATTYWEKGPAPRCLMPWPGMSWSSWPDGAGG